MRRLSLLVPGGTNPNRLFLWTGTNDPLGQHGGPVTTNDHDSNGPVEQGYTGPPIPSACRLPASPGGSTRTWPTTSPTTR
ncbi:alkaline phosphatase family protein [Pseudomonas aeruginosa]|nr:alkaline phosphatase family protein [Pseudomonas aeruginosa]